MPGIDPSSGISPYRAEGNRSEHPAGVVSTSRFKSLFAGTPSPLLDEADIAGESEPAPADDGLASALTGLRVSGSATADAELTPQPVKAFVITGPDGHSRSLEFFRSNQDYLVKEAGADRLFTISQYDFERISGEAGEAMTESAGDGSTPPGT